MYQCFRYWDVVCHFNCGYVARLLFCTARIDSSKIDPPQFIFTTFPRSGGFWLQPRFTTRIDPHDTNLEGGKTCKATDSTETEFI
jgi:hypothetical protein